MKFTEAKLEETMDWAAETNELIARTPLSAIFRFHPGF
jgi:hypothetical protein